MPFGATGRSAQMSTDQAVEGIDVEPRLAGAIVSLACPGVSASVEGGEHVFRDHAGNTLLIIPIGAVANSTVPLADGNFVSGVVVFEFNDMKIAISSERIAWRVTD
jgi:hypothetical protein